MKEIPYKLNCTIVAQYKKITLLEKELQEESTDLIFNSTVNGQRKTLVN
jgi:hypothetical protein